MLYYLSLNDICFVWRAPWTAIYCPNVWQSVCVLWEIGAQHVAHSSERYLIVQLIFKKKQHDLILL